VQRAPGEGWIETRRFDSGKSASERFVQVSWTRGASSAEVRLYGTQGVGSKVVVMVQHNR
jgi:hypothetical protein